MSEVTVLTRNDTEKLWSVMTTHMMRLELSKDYPEREDDRALMDKIMDMKFECDTMLGKGRAELYVISH